MLRGPIVIKKMGNKAGVIETRNVRNPVALAVGSFNVASTVYAPNVK